MQIIAIKAIRLAPAIGRILDLPLDLVFRINLFPATLAVAGKRIRLTDESTPHHIEFGFVAFIVASFASLQPLRPLLTLAPGKCALRYHLGGAFHAIGNSSFSA